MDLKSLQASPVEFRKALLIDADGSPKRLSEALDDWQRLDFESLDPSLQRVVNPANKAFEDSIQRHWWERPRGHSKTSDIAVAVSWLLFASRRKIRGVCGSGDKDQAKLVRDALDTLIRMNPWLGEILEVQALKVVNKHTKSELEILSSDAASSYGHLVDFVVLDEISHWRGRELFDSLFSSIAKRGHCLLLAITNAGFVDSWQWGLREAIRQDAAWRFSRIDGPQASWQSQAALDEQRRLLPDKVYRRLWLNEWSDSHGDALDPDLIDAAIVQARAPSCAEPGWVYAAGLDIGLKHDASALVIVGKHLGWTETIKKPEKPLPPNFRTMIDLGILSDEREDLTEHIHHHATGKLKLAAVKIWTPTNGQTVQFADIEAEIVRLNDLFGISRLAADPWQCENLLQRLNYQLGIHAEATPFVGSNLQSMAQIVLDSFREKNIELYPHTELIADLKGMSIVEKSYGWRLVPGVTQSGTVHADAGTAFALALHASKSISERSVLSPTKTLVYSS